MESHLLTSVLLLKSEETDKNKKSKYEELLISNNYRVMTINTLKFEYVNLDKLFQHLEKPEEYSGMFFASPRCVNAVRMALNQNAVELDPKWKDLDNYVVGNQTYDIAFEKLGLESEGRDTGNANNLADLITKGEVHEKPLLVPHGNLKNNIFKEKLNGHTKLHEILVYETKESTNLYADFQEAMVKLGNLPNFIVFFSPSGVNAAFYLLTRQKDCDRIKLIAIGPTTALSMTEKGLNIYRTLDKPTPESLLSVL